MRSSNKRLAGAWNLKVVRSIVLEKILEESVSRWYLRGQVESHPSVWGNAFQEFWSVKWVKILNIQSPDSRSNYGPFVLKSTKVADIGGSTSGSSKKPKSRNEMWAIKSWGHMEVDPSLQNLVLQNIVVVKHSKEPKCWSVEVPKCWRPKMNLDHRSARATCHQILISIGFTSRKI